jgi:hypothetical protein
MSTQIESVGYMFEIGQYLRLGCIAFFPTPFLLKRFVE